MRAAIVNCFDTYEDRVDLIHEFLNYRGYEVTIIQSDFRHIKKTYRENPKEDFIFLKTKPYFKNLSIARLSSHYKFSKDAFEIIEDIEPELIYVLLPPNSLAKYASQYKIEHNNVKLIFDILDLWPETLPVGKIKMLPPFNAWGGMRNKNLKYADLVITECNLYQSVLKKSLEGIKTETVYLAKKNIELNSVPELSQERIHLAYLGSINNIIDIKKIKLVIRVISEIKPVTLHVVGDGEKKDKLIKAARRSGAIVEDYGKVYDPQQKQDIFDKCHFGLNIMKKNVCVGLTMKSIDYFQHGLPIINNIPADTTNIIDKYNVGVNICGNIQFKNEILRMLDENLDKRKNVAVVYNTLFTRKSFFDKLKTLL